MTLLAPGYELVLGSQKWTTQALAVELELHAAPLLNVLRVRLPAVAAPSTALGDVATLSIDSGESSQGLFSGRVASIRRSFSEVVVRACDAGGTLSKFRPAATYEQASAATVVRSLCGDAGVDVDRLEDGVTFTYYAADPDRTALDHVARVCALSGALARVTAEGKVESLVVNPAQAEVALKYGRDVFDFERGELDAPIRGFVVAGESGAGSAAAPEAARPTTDFFAGQRPTGPDRENLWQWQPALRTAQAAQRAGSARGQRYQSSRRPGRFAALIQPSLRPGSIVEVQELPDELNPGRVFLRSVRHRLSPREASTSARFCEGQSVDPTALLGSLGGLF
jgi:hypothetical protein